ncbi:MAG: hypothetical protein ACI4PZ_04280 [Akkermansia sp.]
MPRPDYKEIATTIVNDPASYKICLVCGALVDQSADTCPDCAAYRFDADPKHVADCAIDLGTRPPSAVTHLDRPA